MSLGTDMTKVRRGVSEQCWQPAFRSSLAAEARDHRTRELLQSG